MAKLSDNHYSIHFIYLLLIFIQKKKERKCSLYQTFQLPLYHYVPVLQEFFKNISPIFIFLVIFHCTGKCLRRSFPCGFHKPISCHLHSYPHASLAPWYWSYFWRGRNGYIKLKRSIWSLMEHGKAPCIACTWGHDAAVLKLIPCSTFCHKLLFPSVYLCHMLCPRETRIL
jgi:hypothetical protein